MFGFIRKIFFRKDYVTFSDWVIDDYLERKRIEDIEIERWVSIGEKLDKIIPAILKVETPKGRDQSWQGFKDLKNIRDRLIHMKSADRKSSGPDAKTIWNDLMKAESPYKQAFTIVKYFINDEGSTPNWFQHGSINLK